MNKSKSYLVALALTFICAAIGVLIAPFAAFVFLTVTL